jgi:hypothetical protein
MKRSRFILLFIGFLAMVPITGAQAILPVSPSFPPPMYLSFSGSWSCQNGRLTAHLQVTPYVFEPHNAPFSTADGWVMLTEQEEGITMHFLVGYYKDQNQFLVVDSDDPAYELFQPDRWDDGRMTLTYIKRPHDWMPANRLVYSIDSSESFGLRWELYEHESWVAHDTYKCTRERKHT